TRYAQLLQGDAAVTHPAVVVAEADTQPVHRGGLADHQIDVHAAGIPVGNGNMAGPADGVGGGEGEDRGGCAAATGVAGACAPVIRGVRIEHTVRRVGGAGDRLVDDQLGEGGVTCDLEPVGGGARHRIPGE